MPECSLDQTHPIQHPFLNAVYNHILLHLIMGEMASPDQDVGVLQDSLSQSVLRLIQGDGLNPKPVRPQEICDDMMKYPRGKSSGSQGHPSHASAIIPNHYLWFMGHLWSLKPTLFRLERMIISRLDDPCKR